MRTRSILTSAILIIGILSIATTFGFGQGIFDKFKEKADKVKDQVNKVKDQAQKTTDPSNIGGNTGSVTGASSGYCWARIQTQAAWEENGKKRYETRIYYRSYAVGRDE